MTNIIQFPMDRIKVHAQLRILPKQQHDQELYCEKPIEQNQLAQRGIVDSSDDEAKRSDNWQNWINKGKII